MVKNIKRNKLKEISLYIDLKTKGKKNMMCKSFSDLIRFENYASFDINIFICFYN